jgi:hypothetical protein
LHRQTPNCSDFSDMLPPPSTPRLTSPLILPGRKWTICALERTSSPSSLPDWLTTSYHSLETLSSFVQSQRELLSRTQHEIERLNALKNVVRDEEDLTADVINQKVRLPSTFCWASLDQCLQLSVGGFGSDEKAGLDVEMVRAMDWSLFKSKGAKNSTQPVSYLTNTHFCRQIQRPSTNSQKSCTPSISNEPNRPTYSAQNSRTSRVL